MRILERVFVCIILLVGILHVRMVLHKPKLGIGRQRRSRIIAKVMSLLVNCNLPLSQDSFIGEFDDEVLYGVVTTPEDLTCVSAHY